MKIVITNLTGDVTDNRRLIPAHGRLISSSEYRAWKKEQIYLVRQQFNKLRCYYADFKEQKPYTVEIWMQNKKTDQANFDKGIRDIITQAGVWNDDKWWYPIYTPCKIDKNNPRAEITISTK
jgi:Holliday junction resolvase RusA-like endonuclease